jgi:SAM-dependent methyltransferase
MSGGYDDGYRQCPCFWGKTPGKLVSALADIVPSFHGLRILDAGCGEGKNAVFFAQRGAFVRAVDVSTLALANARSAWDRAIIQMCTWEQADIQELAIPTSNFDIIVAYGLLHCFRSPSLIVETVKKFQIGTKVGGYNIIVAFNNRKQDLRAHPKLRPCLVGHTDYVKMYANWQLVHVLDTDLEESHPDTNITHTHSLTRILAKKTCENDSFAT